MNMHAKTLLAAALLSLWCIAAQAQQASPVVGAAPQQGMQDAARAGAEVSCLRYTGSLVLAAQTRRNERRARAAGTNVVDKPQCNGSAGQSYTRDDIQRTGALDLVDALRRLDPAVR